MLISNSYRLKRESLKKNVSGPSGGVFEGGVTTFLRAET